MEDRNIEFESRVLGEIRGYKLVFNKRAYSGHQGYANIIPSPSDSVFGVLYALPSKKLLVRMDSYEGVPNHYYRESFTVKNHATGLEVVATTYIAHPDAISDDLLPSKEYLGFLLDGKDVLPLDYVNLLEQHKTCD